MPQYRHARERAIVLFDEELTWPAAVVLVDTVDLLIESYFNTRIEFVITSNGDLALALDHYVAARERWRADGVRVITRAVSHAQSTAAMMLSPSDERIAEPSARLLYHPIRLRSGEALTASDSAEL